VVRYYGGVNLGTGGLIVAYRTAAAEAIAASHIIEKHVEEIIEYRFTYPQMNDVMRIVKDLSPQILAQEYEGASCNIKLSIRRDLAPQLKERLEKLNF